MRPIVPAADIDAHPSRPHERKHFRCTPTRGRPHRLSTLRSATSVAAALSSLSPLSRFLGLKPQSMHAGHASGIPPRGTLTARWKSAVELCFALAIGLLVGQLFLGRSIGYAGEDEHPSGRQHDHSADLSDSEHDDLPCLSRQFHKAKRPLLPSISIALPHPRLMGLERA